MTGWAGALAVGAAVAIAGTASARQPPMRGVIEGYYGRPWTGEARRDVIRFLGARGMNTFVYGPKNDPYHRAEWRLPYPTDAIADMAETVAVAREAGVEFVYALSPALDIRYTSEADFDAVVSKLRQVAAAGVRRFALLFDDAPEVLTDPGDVARYGGSDTMALARAHADLANRVARWLGQRRAKLAFIVPTDYAGTACSPYHEQLRTDLRRRLPVGWTGGAVLSTTVTAAEARARARCLRRPVVLWDNIPVNDTVLSNNLHLGPLTGRDAVLPQALHGYLLNPMTQAHASLVTLGTAAAYLRAPQRYEPEAAWRAALADVGGPGEDFALFARSVRSSALDLNDARELAAVVERIEASFETDDWIPGVDALADLAHEESQAAASLTARLAGSPLGEEIAPWVVEFGAHAERIGDAVRLLRAIKPGLDLSVEQAGDRFTIRGRVVLPDSATAALLGAAFAAEAADVADRIQHPPLGAYLTCLGNLLGADIRFCPELGLNVHGKALFILIRSATDIELITDRNVFGRVVQLAAARWEAWRARRGPGSDRLTVTSGTIDLPLDDDGTFAVSVTIPRGALHPIRVTTGAGETTGIAIGWSAPGSAAR